MILMGALILLRAFCAVFQKMEFDLLEFCIRLDILGRFVCFKYILLIIAQGQRSNKLLKQVEIIESFSESNFLL